MNPASRLIDKEAVRPKMIHVPISQLETGMVLAAPVRHPDVGNHVLLNADFCLDTETIASILRLGVDTVWIRHPGFEFLDDKLSDRVPRTRAELYQTVKRSFTGIANKTVGAFDVLEYRKVVGNMIMTMIANSKNAVWAQRVMDSGDELFAHCSNVAYLSLIIGMRLRDYLITERCQLNSKDALDLTNLGIGAMLHDVGKLGMPDEWHNSHLHEKRSKEDEYRAHPERGYQAVRGRIEATAAAIVIHHHQRFDGRGFPLLKSHCQERCDTAMAGHKIHIFSRIVAVVNTIDGLMSACRQRGKPIVGALAAIRNPVFKGAFDPIIVDAALRTIPPYPLGASVLLSNGQAAVVTGLAENFPCQPCVSLEDEPENEIDLTKPSAPAIVRIDDQEVNGVSYTLTPKCESTTQLQQSA